MGWITNIFKKKDKVKIIEVINKEGQSPSLKIKKIAIIVGHGNGDSGAVGWNGMGEFNYNSFVADILLKAPLNKTIEVFYRTNTGLTGVAKKAVAYKPDMAIELHLNAFNGKAFGCEVLITKGDLISKGYAQSFAKSFCQKFGHTLRREEGVNQIARGERGAASLAILNALPCSLLVEPFFIDNAAEWVSPADYADFLIHWINEL